MTRHRAYDYDNATNPRGLGAYAVRFFVHLEVQNYSAQTVQRRRTYLGYFIAWCEERGILRPQDVTSKSSTAINATCSTTESKTAGRSKSAPDTTSWSPSVFCFAGWFERATSSTTRRWTCPCRAWSRSCP